MRSEPSTDSVGSGWPYEIPRSDDTRLGISFSGGGIRSATFALGAYQSLSERGIFQRARYLSAVSGGCYLAAGVAISHAMSSHDARDPAPWGRGSPEESRLRRNLSYLAPGGQGRLWLAANLVYGLILNLTPLVLGAFLAGRATGAGLRWLYPGLGTAEVQLNTLPSIALTACVFASGAIVLVGARRFRDKQHRKPGELSGTIANERTVTWLAAAAAAILAVGIVVPICVHLLALATSDAQLARLGVPDDASWRVQRFTLALIAVLGAIAAGSLAVWLLRRRLFERVRSVLAALAGVSVIVIPFLLAAETAVVRPFSLAADGVVIAGASAIVLLFAIFAHNRRYSMHLYYRERIQEAFASRRVRRAPAPGAEEVPAAEPIPYSERIMLSDVARRLAEKRADDGMAHPELVICAAVAARGTEVPSKAWAASFTFQGEWSGNRSLGLSAPTENVERGDWIGGGGLTLPSMMAISGAALSPVMGRFTLPAFRFLMAVLNIRLGVWVRNPTHPPVDTPAECRSPARRAWRYAVRGWQEPGGWYVLKEALGLASVKGKYIYVSDGGHWENLGVTELLRRRCSHIVVVDASGDADLGDIGRAVAVARAELGVEVRLDPRTTSPADGALAASPVAVGSFVYPDGQRGEIYFARSVLWDGAPPDLQMLADRDKLFPNHPTGNQFLTGELFDAYRALGWAVGEVLVGQLRLPPTHFDEHAAPQGRTESLTGLRT